MPLSSREDARRSPAAVVFDMDGVLIDSEPIWRAVEQQVFATVGVVLDDDRCRETMGMRVNEVVDHWYRRFPWETPDPRAVEDAVVAGVVGALRSTGAARPGVAHALDVCRAAGLRVAIASSSYDVVIDAVLERLAIASAFDAVVSAQHVERGKPDPAVYLRAIDALGVAPADCVAIEDSVPGVRAARAAGMACIGIPEPGADAAPLRAAGATVVLESLLELRPAHLEVGEART
ncbi:MAG TPA: hexitol phosphatase HxpB [Acidimicrobiia bacterium]|nr:hexitol phosphatase HxpB [Acidimicrobiia bacterium]